MSPRRRRSRAAGELRGLLTGRVLAFQRIFERTHHAHAVAAYVRAARCGFWLGISSLLRGETGPANGWLARARRLVESRDCVEHGYLLLPAAEQCLAEGNGEAAHRAASRAVSSGSRFGDADLVACGRHLQGRALIQQGQTKAGLVMLDEAMLAVITGELSPIMTGLIYCSVIEACLQARARTEPRSRVDLGVLPMVRAATRDGGLHGHMSGTSCGRSAIPRRVARCNVGSASRLRAFAGRLHRAPGRSVLSASPY